jgi:hypothetical protein
MRTITSLPALWSTGSSRPSRKHTSKDLDHERLDVYHLALDFLVVAKWLRI